MSCIFISFFHPPIHTPIVAFSITLQPAYYTPWTPWSEACSNDCGAGTQGRTRTCLGLCEPSKDPACAVGSDDPVTRPCSGGPAATWKEYEPQVCVGDQRPWTRACDARCHGTCAGSATEMRNCTWAPLIAWAGPLYPTASAPLTATMMASDLAAALRAAVMEAVIDNGEAVVGTVSALMDAATTDGERRRRRDQESALAHVDDGMVVTAGDAAGSVWLRVEAQLLPEAEPSVVALLPLHTGNLTGAARALAPTGVSLALAADAPVPAKKGEQAGAGAAVGAVVACIICIVLIVVVVRRRRQSKRHPLKSDADGQQPWMTDNPLYKGEHAPSSPAPSGASGEADNDAPPRPPKAAKAWAPDTETHGYSAVGGAAAGSTLSGASDTYDTPRAANQDTAADSRYQSLGTAGIVSPGHYDPLQHDKNVASYASLGAQTAQPASDYSHFSKEPSYQQLGSDAHGRAPSHASAGTYNMLEKDDGSASQPGLYQGLGTPVAPVASTYNHIQRDGQLQLGDEENGYFDVSGGECELSVSPPPLPAKAGQADSGEQQPAYDLATPNRTGPITRYEDVPPPSSAALPAAAKKSRPFPSAQDDEAAQLPAEDAWAFFQIATGCSLALDSRAAAALVAAGSAGTFLIRRSTRAGRGLVLTFNNGSGVIHEHITTSPDGQAGLCGRTSASVLQLIRAHRRLSVGATSTTLTAFAPVIAAATVAALRVAAESKGSAHANVALGADGRPVGAWPTAAVLAVAEAAVDGGAAAESSGISGAAAATVGLDGLLSACTGHHGRRAWASEA